MHLSVRNAHTLEEGDAPVNPDQSPADMLVLSFTDSDLACFENAHDSTLPTLRLTNLARLKHPLSVDLYIDQVAMHAKIIVVRLIGGYEWWRYGVDELSQVAREKNIALAFVPGDGRPDERLAEFSTVPADMLAAIDRCLSQGGTANARSVLESMAALVRKTQAPMPVATVFASGAAYKDLAPTQYTIGHALIIFYRAHYLSADTAPIDAMLQSLADTGLHTHAFMVTSLKDPAALDTLRAEATRLSPDIILDATAFSASTGEDSAHPLASLTVPIFQVALANTTLDTWSAASRGMGASDLAMHVVLPETDGRVFTRAISFKQEAEKNAVLEFTRIVHAPQKDRVDFVAALCCAWVKLAKKNAHEKHIALVLSDYPARAGRNAYAVGLDAPESAVHILHILENAGYGLSAIPECGTALMEQLREPCDYQTYAIADYRARFDALPPAQRDALIKAWGAPESDTHFSQGVFRFSILTCRNIRVMLQPDRGAALDRKSSYHDPVTPPRHGYLAFYWWLQECGSDAMIHLGTHGNLEWLPGKTVALSSSCWPEIALGPMPVIYPYIVSDPGEAAQAKRRIAGVTISHLTPPLASVALTPELAELERLTDEYAGADGLDARRMKLLRSEIMDRARRSGLPGIEKRSDEDAVMASLESQLCDIKEQRVATGLHIFGKAITQDAADAICDTIRDACDGDIDTSAVMSRLERSPLCERNALLAALDGRFIAPSSGGSPSRGRMDVLPTGRNLIAIDPRAIPTQTAAIIGKRAAEEFVRRFVQDHGEWPKSIVIDVWGASTLRNGGDDIAQALHLMGVRPLWDHHSQRVTGFEIMERSETSWPRIDVSLRISGMFRDMFENIITLFDDAVQAVARLDEDEAFNPLAATARHLEPPGFREATWRIFGSAPGTYGAGVTELVDHGFWTSRKDLGRAYLEASRFAYGRGTAGISHPEALAARVEHADAFLHMQDQRDIDVLEGADFADAEGGFAAAAHTLGATPALYHLDTSRPHAIKARTLAEEISLTLHARAVSHAWIEGQMQHGYAGAAAMANVVDQLFTFAATTDAVSPRQFDAVFDAYLHDEAVRNFMHDNNPDALAAVVSRFDEAIMRGLWNPLRNSVHPLLEVLREIPALKEKVA